MAVALKVMMRSIGMSAGRQVFGSAFNLASFAIVARSLGPEGAGQFALALLLPMMLAQLLNVGLASSNVYFISSGRVELVRAWSATRNIVGLLLVSGLLIGLCIVMFWSDVIFPSVGAGLLVISLAIFPFTMLNSIIIGFFQAREDFSSYNRVILLQPFVSMAGMVALFILDILTVRNALLSMLGSHVCASAAALLTLRYVVPLRARATGSIPYLKKALAFGSQVHVNNSVAFVNRRLDLFLVNLLVSAEASGQLALANRIIEQIWILATAISTVLFPRLSSLNEDDPQRTELTELMSRIALWVSIIAAAILAAVLEPVLDLVFGRAFLPVFGIVLLMLPGAVLRSVSQILANDFAARGRVGLNLMLGIMVLVINVGLNLYLIPLYGVLGAAAATSIAYSVMALLRLSLQRHLTHLKPLNALLPRPSDVAAVKRLIAAARRPTSPS